MQSYQVFKAYQYNSFDDFCIEAISLFRLSPRLGRLVAFRGLEKHIKHQTQAGASESVDKPTANRILQIILVDIKGESTYSTAQAKAETAVPQMNDRLTPLRLWKHGRDEPKYVSLTLDDNGYANSDRPGLHRQCGF